MWPVCAYVRIKNHKIFFLITSIYYYRWWLNFTLIKSHEWRSCFYLQQFTITHQLLHIENCVISCLTNLLLFFSLSLCLWELDFYDAFNDPAILIRFVGNPFGNVFFPYVENKIWQWPNEINIYSWWLHLDLR